MAPLLTFMPSPMLLTGHTTSLSIRSRGTFSSPLPIRTIYTSPQHNAIDGKSYLYLYPKRIILGGTELIGTY
eukprot:gene8666-6092_t